MSIYNPALKPLNMSEIKRYSGLDQYTDFPAHLLDGACTEAYILAQPQASWEIYDYDVSTATIMGPEPLTLHAPKILHYLCGSARVVVIALTIGPKLENKVSEYFSNGEYTSGLLLDAAGTAAVEVAADQVCEFIKRQAAHQGYLSVIDALRTKFPKIQGPRKDDICYATQNRQDAVRDLAEQCDVVLVVGSPNSSNSNRLRELAERMGKRAYLVDNADELEQAWFQPNTKIGVTAGASAPEILIKQVIQRLQDWGATPPKELQGREENITFSLPKELRIQVIQA